LKRISKIVLIIDFVSKRKAHQDIVNEPYYL